MKKKNKKKLRSRGIITILIIILIILAIFFYLWNKQVNKVIIQGNTYLKDNYIINYLDIDESSILRVNSGEIKNKLLELDLISDVNIRKSLLGILTINITEDKVLFYDKNINKVVLSSGKKTDYNFDFLGVPTLINTVNEEVYKDLINKLNRVDKDVLSIVSEIEYSPSEVNGKIVDDTRFLFRMNDGNVVFINTINIEKINNYIDIYEAVMNKGGVVKGCLYLDSNSENKHFGSCDEKKIVEEDKEEVEKKDGEN